ncbi:sideroflexin-2-like [Hylaeus anthracinus]|uniref:sideroflexin-2-like n=1 Tax=Hylaeus anthracinus TaxID=313031 RepID=UPI0023B9C68D|nr:sideroflexin-2-like [Hylaeus anthracinus]
MDLNDKIDIDQPLWDQSTYIGRWKHAAFISDSRTVFVPEKELWKAKQFCDDYRDGKVPPDTTMKDVIHAKQLRDSAFHPDNGELMHVIGRMSFQLPSSIIITTAMLTYYKSTVATVLCQIVNQTQNAIVNYSNRNAMEGVDKHDSSSIKTAFLCAIIASSAVAIGCRRILHRREPIICCRRTLHRRESVISRCVPFFAVTAGHIVNMPLMRQKEIKSGVPVFIEGAEKPFMQSRVAAVIGISECIITRIGMSLPCLLFIPVITQTIKQYCFYQRRPWIRYPIKIVLCAVGCLISIPSSLALFPRYNSMRTEWLKLCPKDYEEFKRTNKEDVDRIYYYKGL